MISQIIFNVLLQIFLFIICMFFIPWIASLFAKHFDDVKLLVEKMEQVDSDEEQIKIAKLGVFMLKIRRILTIIDSWTVGLCSRILFIFVLFVTFNHPSGISFSVDRGILTVYCEYDAIKRNIWRPCKAIGHYFSGVVINLFGPAVSLCLLRLLLPNTFSSIVLGLSQWCELQLKNLDISFMISAKNAFIDIVWLRFVSSGWNENPILLIVFIFCFSMLSSSASVSLIELENNKPSSIVYSFPVISVFIILLNVALSQLNPFVYTNVSYYVNSLGLILLLLIIVSQIAYIVAFCLQKTALFILDKIT